MEWIIFLEYWDILYLRKLLSQIRTYTIRIHWHVYTFPPSLLGRLFDWRPERPVGARQKCEKVVILKNMFTPSDFDVSIFFFYHINIFSNFYISSIYFIFHPFLTDFDFLQFYFSKMPYKVCNLKRKKPQKDVVKLFNYVWVSMGVKAKEAILMYFILGFFFLIWPWLSTD